MRALAVFAAYVDIHQIINLYSSVTFCCRDGSNRNLTSILVVDVRSKVRFLAPLLLIAALCGCSAQPDGFVATDLVGADFAQGFELTAQDGSRKSLQDFKGKVVVVFFGYTHCPDICPTTMQDLSKAVQLLGDDAQQVQVLFVTLDPERDNVEVLKQFVPGFNASFIGLTGSRSEIDAVAQQYKIFAQKQTGKDATHYSIDHSAGAYVYDKQGHLRLYFKYAQTPQDMAHDLQLLL